MQPIPLEQIHPAAREKARLLAERPTLLTRGPVEQFHCQPNMYRWLLDNPQSAAKLWRCLGAKVADIEPLGEGRFTWKDSNGSRINWETVLATATERIWLAEGQVKASLLLPMIHVKALLVVHHVTGKDSRGQPCVRHQMDLMIQTDNRAIALATRVMGASAPKSAEQFVGQIEMFFGALAWYLDQNPREAAVMFAEIREEPPQP